MTIYSAYLPPAGDARKEASEFRLVPDKNSLWALALPLPWLVWHRLWLVLLVYLVFMGGLGMLATSKPGLAILYLYSLPGLYLYLEGRRHIMNKYERNGWRFFGVVEGDTHEDAELRFIFENQDNMRGNEAVKNPPIKLLPETPVSSIPHPVSSSPPGLFPE